MNFYKHHIGDYAAATAHLSFVEDAAYSRLLRIYYRDERPLPVDTGAVQRLAGARSKEERVAVETVLREFFVLADDGWHSKRCDEEIARATAQAETNKRIAADREARRRQRSDERSEHDSLHASSNESSQNREPSQTPDSRQEQKHSAQPSASRFADFWNAYPRKRGKKPAAAKWKAKRLDDQADTILADVRQRIRSDDRWKRGFIPDPATYLGQERWDDAMTDATPAPESRHATAADVLARSRAAKPASPATANAALAEAGALLRRRGAQA